MEPSDASKKAIMELIGKIILRKAIRLAPVDLGELRSKMGYRIEGNFIIMYCEAEYSGDLEYGKPAEPLSQSEKDNLTSWAKRHDLPAGPVISKIQREGIKVGTFQKPMKVQNGTYRPFIRPAIFQSRQDIRSALAGLQ